MNLDVYKIDGSKTGEQISLNDNIFAIEPNDHVIYLSVKAHLANKRQGTHKAKERSEVNGGGKKPWKQKGRGGARAAILKYFYGLAAVQYLDLNQEIIHSQ